MIVTVGGAYRNCGDHLIGARGRALIRQFADADVVAVDRRQIDDSAYDLFDKARAVLLCGGPAYQRGMYPDIYPIERKRVRSPIIPFGLGWKASAGTSVENFAFKPEALSFIRAIHAGIETGSVRDPLTRELLHHTGISNVLMTGCPAWYDLDYFDVPYRFAESPATVVFSMPAIMQPGVFELMSWLSRRFPKARRILSYHHGLVPTRSVRGLRAGRKNLAFALSARRRGWEAVSLAGNLPRMEALYTSADLHVGYRVHAHLLCLSRRRASILINEDARGAGQTRALGAESLSAGTDDIEPLKAAVERHFDTRGEEVQRSVETMRSTFPVMRSFLSSI